MADNKDKKVLNVPALRFPEFTEEWREYAIGNVLSIGNGRDYKHLHNGDIPVFGTGGYMTSVDDFLYDGESVFIGRKGTINKPLYYNGKFWTVDTLFYTHSFVNVLPKFAYCLFQTINWLKYNEASGVPSLSKATIEKIKVRVPSMDEQGKLSNQLFLLDKRIEVQNKIIEKLETLIKGFVDSIFTANKFPKVPFKEIYVRAGEGGTPATSNPEYYDNGTIPFIKIDDLQNKYIKTNKDCITELGLQKSSAWIVPANSIIYSNGATIGAISINLFPVCTKQGILGVVPKADINVEFLYYFMTSTAFTKAVERIVTEGTMRTAYLKDINHIPCPVPYPVKQDEIAKMLSTLSEKLENEVIFQMKLQKQKEFLLSQMFI